MKIYQQVKNSVEKRRNCSLGAISPLFHNIFYISLTSHINLLNVVVWIIFSWIFKIWYVEVWISQSISESPFDFEITRVDCIFLISPWKPVGGTYSKLSREELSTSNFQPIRLLVYYNLHKLFLILVFTFKKTSALLVFTCKNNSAFLYLHVKRTVLFT